MEMEIDFEKMGGLVPAIIQDAVTKNVLMLGFMNKEAYEKTIATKKVTFWSRSRNCLWTKGETSGNYLDLVSIQNDCDKDTLLVKVHPQGPHLLGRGQHAEPYPLPLRVAGLHQQAS